MRQRDENYISMCRATRVVLNDYLAVWTPIPAVKNLVTDFYDTMDSLEAAVIGSEIESTGATVDKTVLKSKAVRIGVDLAKRASVYALNVGNHELHDQLRVTKSTLEKRPDTLSYTKLMDIHARILALATDLADYGILPADITALHDAITAYDAVIERPRRLIVERSVHNQENIPALLAEIREILYKLDSMMNLFNDQPLAAEYKRARMVIDLGTRKDSDPLPPVTD